MRTDTSGIFRRWMRRPATLPRSLVLKAENFIEDHAAIIIDFSLGGVGVLTSRALVPGERVKNRRQRGIPGGHPYSRGLGTGGSG